MNFPARIFNLPVTIKGPAELRGYPNVYTSGYDCQQAVIGGVACLVFEPRSDIRPLQVSKMFQRVSEGEGVACLLACPTISAYQRRGLSERGVAWLKDEDTFHIPFLMASCNARRTAGLPAATLSPGAQQIAAHAIDGSWDGMTTSEVAARIGKSLSSVSAYFAEVSAADSTLIGSRGRTRFIVSPASAAERLATFERMERFMASPVKRRMRLACNDAMPAELARLPLSGVSALSSRTMVAADPWETRAVSASDKATLAAVGEYAIPDGEFDEPDLLLEVWAYEPDESDLISLYLDVKTLADDENDERLEQAAAELKGLIFDEHGIEGVGQTALSPEAFDEFRKMLETPMPQAALDLLARKPAWE